MNTKKFSVPLKKALSNNSQGKIGRKQNGIPLMLGNLPFYPFCYELYFKNWSLDGQFTKYFSCTIGKFNKRPSRIDTVLLLLALAILTNLLSSIRTQTVNTKVGSFHFHRKNLFLELRSTVEENSRHLGYLILICSEICVENSENFRDCFSIRTIETFHLERFLNIDECTTQTYLTTENPFFMDKIKH